MPILGVMPMSRPSPIQVNLFEKQFYQGKLLFLFLLSVVHIYYTLTFFSPGPLSIDEGTYHLMAKNFADSYGWEIENGYREFPSEELRAAGQLVAHDGRLVSQYPCFYTVLALPFYRLGGYGGLIFLNALSFLGVVALTYAIAQRLLLDKNLSLNACLIFFLATYAWEYTQSSLPHMVSMLFLMGAVYLGIGALSLSSSFTAKVSALASGLLIGFGTGIRLDVFFVFPLIIIPFIFVNPKRYKEALLIIIGTLPGLLFLAATNYLKFNIFSPFSYGRLGTYTKGVGPYLPFVILYLAMLVAIYLLRRPLIASFLKNHPKSSTVIVFLGGGICFLIPQIRAFLMQLAQGFYTIVVDLCIYNNPAEPYLRSQGGSILIISGVKKAFLQCCPYLVILILSFYNLIKEGNKSSQLIFLFGVPIIFIAIYAYFTGHAGLCLNNRYLLPILPITSIGCAYAWRYLSNNLDTFWKFGAFITAFLMVVPYLFFTSLSEYWLPPITIDQQDLIYLVLPLCLSAILAILTFACILTLNKSWEILQGITLLCFVAGMTWSGLLGFFYDYPLSYRCKKYNQEVSLMLAGLISPDALFFGQYPEPFYGLMDSCRIRLAIPDSLISWDNDHFRDFRPLAEYHLSLGRPVYGAFFHTTWIFLQSSDLLHGLEMTPLWENQDLLLIQLMKPQE